MKTKGVIVKTKGVIVKLKKEIIIRATVAGVHQWPEAPNEVAFLKHRHRHLFGITVGFAITQSNREKEFFIQRRAILNAIGKEFGYTSLVYDFRTMSCETIAETLAILLDADWCEVSEDGENSARVTIERD